MIGKWAQGDGTPDGAKLHSILVDPRDAKHLYLSLSGGGTFESSDGGESWAPLNKGVAMDFAPPGDYEYGHDPHCVVYHPADPDRLYQQNHCGIYRIHRPETTWTRIGDNMPKEVGDIGFPIVVHPREVDTAWVWPMDGTDVWPRTSPGGKPAAYRTQDGGESWERQDQGLPERGWFSVKRQCMTNDASDPGRPLRGHQQRRGLREQRRGRDLAHDRAPPPAHLLGDRRGLPVIVRLPGLLDKYTGGQREHEVEGQTVADALQVLEERYPGIRFRLIDEQGRVRTHINIFVGQDSIEDLATVVREGQEVFVVGGAERWVALCAGSQAGLFSLCSAAAPRLVGRS